MAILPKSDSSQSELPESVYRIEDLAVGGLLTRKWKRTVYSAAEDYEQFLSHFKHLSEGLREWREDKGRKAAFLHLEIEVHPWIIKRVRDHLMTLFPVGHDFGDYASQSTVTLHLYDFLDHEGQYWLLYDRGKAVLARTDDANTDQGSTSSR